MSRLPFSHRNSSGLFHMNAYPNIILRLLWENYGMDLLEKLHRERVYMGEEYCILPYIMMLGIGRH